MKYMSDWMDEFKKWEPRMKERLGEDYWKSLTFYQQMLEIIAVKENNKDFFKDLVGF